MILKEFIEKLQALGCPELPVCLADWNEEYAKPNTGPAEEIRVVDGAYYSQSDGKVVHGKFVKIGDDGE